MDKITVSVEEKEITITNPNKYLWKEEKITKLDYIHYLIMVAPYLLPYTSNRLLTMIRYPDGVQGKSFYQKGIPAYVPQWLTTVEYKDKNYVLLNDLATLVWVGSQAALELHVPFNTYFRENYPSEMIIDLDPMEENNFNLVQEIALQTKETLDSFGLNSYAKTSGATGLQIYIPLKPNYTYEETRMVVKFIADYITEKNPLKVTVERSIKKRGSLLYFDYLQFWRGKTLPAPYSVRGRNKATVSAPLEWEEVQQKKIRPEDFTILTMKERISRKGDVFSKLTTTRNEQNIDEILRFIKTHEDTIGNNGNI